MKHCVERITLTDLLPFTLLRKFSFHLSVTYHVQTYTKIVVEDSKGRKAFGWIHQENIKENCHTKTQAWEGMMTDYFYPMLSKILFEKRIRK